MRINVIVDEATIHPHDADWVDHETSAGELTITRRDIHGTVEGWTLYARGCWMSAGLAQTASQEVLRARADAELRDRQPPSNSGPWTRSSAV